ncbi:hypothetical protein ACERIM_04480 [Natrinema sp. H-ect1]|uniref:HD domain-containing protein n=1 Tax=Natrinema sp. H-ect1 TaxID=3242700 RepID=UPI00359CDB26
MATLEGALESVADEGNESADTLLNNYRSVKRYLEREYYPWVLNNCRWFTDHGEKHVKSVISQLDCLLSEELESDDYGSLSYMDMYLLLTSAIWHDVGMVSKRAGHEDEAARIAAEIQDLAFPNTGIQSVVSRIVKAHTGDGKNGLEIPRTKTEVTIGHESFTVKSRSLSALLRFADEISENQERVSAGSAIWANIPEESEIYWRFADSITGIVSKPRRNTVSVNIELTQESAMDRYPVPDEYESRGTDGKITLIEYIICRIEKMNNEKVYCASEFRGFVDIRNMQVRLSLIGEGGEIEEEINETLGISGLASADGYPNVEIYDKFFQKNKRLSPEKLEAVEGE